jgi:putative toxin-antitoxin system antitoxin component (TIGR02293 family)
MAAVESLASARREGPLAAARPNPLPKAWRFDRVFDFDELRLVELIKQGLPAAMPGEIASRMGVAKDRVYQQLGLPRATVERKVREAKPLSPDESSRVLGLARLVGQAQRMVEESGRPQGFDAAVWVAGWLERPVAALGGRRPAELMDTAEGQAIVAATLSRAQSAAYA